MQDKSKNGDDEEFSLNKLDLNDEDQKPETSDSDVFNELVSGSELTDSAHENDKQAPTIAEALEPTQEIFMAAERDVLDADCPAAVSESSFSAAEQPLIAADMDRLDDVFSEGDEQQQPVQERFGSRMMTSFMMLAIVIVALVAWLNMGNDEGTAESERYVSQPVLDKGIQMQRSEKKLLEMQQRLISLQERLAAKDEQIAELTHLASEQSRKRVKLAERKATPVIQKVRPVVKKVVRKSVFKPIQSVQPIVRKQTGWVIVIASVATRSAADKALKGLQANGIHAEVKPTTVKGRPWYRIQLSGFSSRQEANMKKAYLKTQYGIKDTWIHKPG